MGFKKGHWYKIQNTTGFTTRAPANRFINQTIKSRMFIATHVDEHGDVSEITEITGEIITKPDLQQCRTGLINWFTSSEYQFVTDCTPEHVLNPVAVPLNFSAPPGFYYVGAWDAVTKYTKNDCVHYNKQIWACDVIRVGGITPGFDSIVWKLVTSSNEEFKIEIPGVKEYKFASSQQLCDAAYLTFEMCQRDQKIRGVTEPAVIVITHGTRKFKITGWTTELTEFKSWVTAYQAEKAESRNVQKFEIKD